MFVLGLLPPLDPNNVTLFHLCRGAPKKPLGFRVPVDNVGRTLPQPALRQVWGCAKIAYALLHN